MERENQVTNNLYYYNIAKEYDRTIFAKTVSLLAKSIGKI